tara:strand:+ start:796 stop:1341 length:546 start_codon:yes stop_codon:yes gene_type:complete
MSVLKVDTINEKTSGNGVVIADMTSPGHIIQTVIGSTFGTENSTASSSFVRLGSSLEGTITPKFSSSKIEVTLTIANLMFWQNVQDTRIQFGITRDNGSSFVREYNNRFYDYGGSGAQFHYTPTLVAIDSPGSTSALTYKLYAKIVSSSGNIRINDDQGSGTSSGTAGACFSQFILREIAQ